MIMNWLKFNDIKTEFAIFGSKQNLAKLSTPSILVGDARVGSSNHVKILGAYLDSELEMDMQVSSVCRAAWFHLYQIGKIRQYLTEDQVKSVIHAYVTCRLDLHNGLLTGLPKRCTNKLQLVQNAAARLITRTKKSESVKPVLKRLHWLPVEMRAIYKLLLITYKCVNGQGPTYLTELLVPYKPRRLLRSSFKKLLVVPQTHYAKTRKRAFGIRAPTEWNKLPQDLRDAKSVCSFRKGLKTYLFKLSFKLK